MIIEGTLNEADYVAAQYLHMRPRPVFAIVSLLMLALIIWVIAIAPSPLLFGAVVYLIAFFVIFIPWRAKRNFRQHKVLSEPASIEMREDGLYRKSQYGESLTPWTHIHRWRQGKKLLLLYLANNLFYIIPSRFFATPDDYEKFAEAIMARLGHPS